MFLFFYHCWLFIHSKKEHRKKGRRLDSPNSGRLPQDLLPVAKIEIQCKSIWSSLKQFVAFFVRKTAKLTAGGTTSLFRLPLGSGSNLSDASRRLLQSRRRQQKTVTLRHTAVTENPQTTNISFEMATLNLVNHIYFIWFCSNTLMRSFFLVV